MAYFDYNATTPLCSAAREALLSALDGEWFNPSSPYRASARVHAGLEGVRNHLASILNCDADTLLFNSGATEGNNAVFAWLAETLPPEKIAVVSRTEHPSVIEAAKHYLGGRVSFLEVDADGQVDLNTLERLIDDFPVALVSMMAANNETGVLGPMEAVESICRKSNVWFHCDASQWLGKRPAEELQSPDFITGCAHKSGGPKGVGFLKIPEGVSNFHSGYGGEQEQNRRAGTENFPAIAAMVAALAHAEDMEMDANSDRKRRRDQFEEDVLNRIAGARINARTAPRLWNTVSITLPTQENHRWLRKLDQLGFEISTGSACASGSEAPSHVLAAMGLAPEVARRTIRVSAGWQTNDSDWRSLADALVSVWEQFRRETPGQASVVDI